MFALGLRPVQQALDQKANQIQHEFILTSEQLEDIARKLLEATDEDRQKLREQQSFLRDRQHTLADEVNTWRGRARGGLGRCRLMDGSAELIESFLHLHLCAFGGLLGRIHGVG